MKHNKVTITADLFWLEMRPYQGIDYPKKL